MEGRQTEERSGNRAGLIISYKTGVEEKSGSRRKQKSGKKGKRHHKNLENTLDTDPGAVV